MGKKPEVQMIKKSLTQATTGQLIHRNTAFMKSFGCLKCTWASTSECPHGIKAGRHHANHICGARVMYLKERLVACGTVPKLIQQEELFKLSQISDRLLYEYYEEGELPDEFKHISKLIVSLTDKMRRQDEGIKLQGELTVHHEDFRNMVNVEAKKIEERNRRTRPAVITG